jgi:hypothetical protein
MTSAPKMVGTYKNSSDIHRLAWELVTNKQDATGSFSTLPVFLSGFAAPIDAALPLLDTNKLTAGTGGDSSVPATQARIGTTTDLALGQRKLIEFVDSPAAVFPDRHPGWITFALTQVDLNLNFGGSLTLWTNASGAIGRPATWLIEYMLSSWNSLGVSAEVLRSTQAETGCRSLLPSASSAVRRSFTVPSYL